MIPALLLLTFVAVEVSCQTLSPNNTLQCRLCNSASTLSDCNKLQTCDPTTEECYMDQLVTDQLSIVYNGGCRAKSVCASILMGRRSDQVACSRCCNLASDCNKRLCGIKDDIIASSQCYSCDHRTSEQSAVRDPTRCVTLDTCQPNEQCQFLMKQAYEHYVMCVKNDTSLLPLGMSWYEACHSAATALCHSCCADGGCNYGTCSELNKRIFNLVGIGKFDMTTLKVI